jgi:hypothetical protein
MPGARIELAFRRYRLRVLPLDEPGLIQRGRLFATAALLLFQSGSYQPSRSVLVRLGNVRSDH